MVIAPHPDDAEISMGGTIASLSSKGHNVTVLDITNGEPTPRGSVSIRLKEAKAAGKILKIKKRIILDHPNRYLFDTIECRKEIAGHIRNVRPEFLFIPNNIDAHPDHISASSIGIASRFYAKLTKTDIKGEPFYPPKLIFYLCSHMKLDIKPAFILPFTKREFNLKAKAVREYKSQFAHRKDRNVIDFVETWNKYYGNLINSEYGEPFYTPEVIGLKDLTNLV